MFISPTKGKLPQTQLIDSVADFIEEKPDLPYRLIIGSDSHLRGKNGESHLKLVTAIIVHRVGLGGRYFWQAQHLKETKTLRDKIYAETLESLSFASTFVPLLKKSLNGKTPLYNLEIHIDVGEHGDTRDMIKEVVGMVAGNGFVARTKPNAYGASCVADRHT